MRIRRIEEKDIKACVDLGEKLHAESEYSTLSYNKHKCGELLKLIMADQDQEMFIADSNQELIGMMGCGIKTPYFSDDKVAGDMLIYVLPEHRKSLVFPRLINRFYQWASQNGAKMVYLSNTTNIDSEKTESVYLKLGFERVGGIFRRFL